METLLVMPRNKEEFNIINDMLAKMNIKSRVINSENEEDIDFLSLIEAGDKADYVDESEIINFLNKVKLDYAVII